MIEDVLLNVLPAALGFAGFCVYHRYFVAPPPGPAKELSVDLSEPVDAVASDVDSEPEPGPEPDLSDESPKHKSSLDAKDEVDEVAVESQRSGTAQRFLVIGAYLAVTAAVFAHFCMEPAADTKSVEHVEEDSEAVQAEREALLDIQREKAELPYWHQTNETPPAVQPNEDQFVNIVLNRQFMTLRGEDGTIVYYKSAYWGYLTCGTPPEAFKVVFDTGSGHLILPSSYCSSDTCKAHKRYKRRFSTTAKDIDHDGTIVEPGNPRDQITVSFGTGEVSGVFVDDVVCVQKEALPPPKESDASVEASEPEMVNPAEIASPDAEDPAMEVAGVLEPGCFRLRVVLATEMSEDPFKDFHFDGVLGLGLSPLSQAFEFNFPGMVTRLVEQLDAPASHIFSVFLAKHDGETSELSIGGTSRARQGGPFLWSPVILPDHGHWMLGIKNIYVDGELLEFCRDGSCRAVADTGTSLLAVPSAAFPELYELLRHNAPVRGYCNDAGPSLQFEMAGDNFTITMRPEDYSSLEPIAKPKNRTRDWFKRFFYAKGWPHVEQPKEKFRRDMYCKPLLMSMDLPAPIGPKLFILGEPLLRRYYTVYDTKAQTIGWSQAVHVRTPKEQVKMEESDEWWDDEDEV